jgi:uncharacterized protein (TIGR00369 family)
MSDRQKRCEELIALFSRAPIKETFGMELRFNENQEAVFDLPHNPRLEHGFKDTHGGILATLLDNAGWFSAAVHYDTWIATLEMQMRLLEPANREDLRAVGRVRRAGGSFAVAEMEVRTASGRLVATGSGTFAVTSLKYPQEDS